MRSDVDQLRVFCRVVKLGSFTRAAHDLYLTQPAVSAQIAKLEQRLKVKLVDRIGRRVFPTEAGKLLYSYAEQVERLCALVSEAEQVVSEADPEVSGKVAIGASTTISVYVLPSILGRFKRLHPRVDMALAVGTTRNILEGLSNNLYDFSLLEGPVDVPGIDSEGFLDDELCLAVPGDHPWAGRVAEGVTLEEVTRETFISHRPGSGIQTAIDREFRRHGLETRPSMVIEHIEVVMKVVEAGLGVSILSKLIMRNELERGTLVQVPVRDAAFRREFKIATLRGKYLSRPVRTFLSFFKDEVAARYPV